MTIHRMLWSKLKLWIGSYLNSDYRKGFLFVLSSKSLIILVTFLTTPIIARIYSPEDYGLFALLNSVAMLWSLLATLSLPTCLLVVHHLRITVTTTVIVGYTIASNLVMITAGVIVIGMFGQDIVISFFPVNFNTILLVSVFSILMTASQIFANLNVRNKAFSRNVIVNLVDNFSVRISSLGLGFLGFTKYGLFISDLIGKTTGIIVQVCRTRATLATLFNIRYLDRRHFITEFRRNKEFVVYNFPLSLVNSFISQIILWLLALNFSGTSVGYFTMSVGLLNIPLTLISNSFQPLITSKLFNELSTFSYKNFFKLSVGILSIGLIVYFAIFVSIPFFIEIYLGEHWLSTVSLIQILCLPFALQLLGNSIGGVYIVLEKQRASFYIKLASLSTLVIGFNILVKSEVPLKDFVIFYAVVLVLEETLRITYIFLRLRHVGGH